MNYILQTDNVIELHTIIQAKVTDFAEIDFACVKFLAFCRIRINYILQFIVVIASTNEFLHSFAPN